MHQLRPYQADVRDHCQAAWDGGARCVMPVVATGGGKTVIVGDICRTFPGIGVAIAHRQELVGQISLQLAREGVYHDLLVSGPLRRAIIRSHHEDEEVGRSYVRPGAPWYVGGVDTIVRMGEAWFERVGLVVIDEGHHVLRANKWGKAFAKFPNARGLFPTATPLRADGQGLGAHADGLVDALVQGPCGRELIDAGFLTEYRVICPPNRLDLSRVALSAATGDLSLGQLRKETHRAGITGDVVAHYLKHAEGKRGVTFAVDVEEAAAYAEAFNARGVPAAVVHAKTPDALRRAAVRDLRAGRLLQLCNVDLFGEGFDLPAIEVVSMARATASYGLYSQQFGRALRLMPGKDRALIIDHVGNFCRPGFGPPDAPRPWSLDRREKRAKSDSGAIPLRACANPMCLQPYPRIYAACPHCGHAVPPASRSTPEAVDGDLEELDPSVLADLRREIARIQGDAHPPRHLSGPAQAASARQHVERRQAHEALRHAMDTWAAIRHVRPLSECYREFFFRFGVDVATAQTLPRADAEGLRERIEGCIVADGYVIN